MPMLSPERLSTPVREFMRPGVITIAEHASLLDAKRAMARHGVHAILVVGEADGRPLGWVTDSGLLPWLERDLDAIQASHAITEPAHYIEPASTAHDAVEALAANALLLEQFIARESKEGRLTLPLGAVPKKALLHGHCHQKAFDAMGAVESALRLIPELAVETVESSCCGMAGSFGYDAETIDVSLKMGELSLLPAVRRAEADALIVADGTSCRHQIHDGSERGAMHVARVLKLSLEAVQ